MLVGLWVGGETGWRTPDPTSRSALVAEKLQNQMLSLTIHSLLMLAMQVSAQSTACSLPPTTDCLVQHSQFTVLGIVTATNNISNSPGNYNVTMQINCVFASFSSPAISSGAGLAGNIVTVVNWGNPKVGCPTSGPNTGASAPLNSQQLCKLY